MRYCCASAERVFFDVIDWHDNEHDNKNKTFTILEINHFPLEKEIKIKPTALATFYLFKNPQMPFFPAFYP